MGQQELSDTELRKSVELDPHSREYPDLHVPLISRSVPDDGSLMSVRRLGLLGLIILAFVAAFRLSLRAPTRRNY